MVLTAIEAWGDTSVCQHAINDLTSKIARAILPRGFQNSSILYDAFLHLIPLIVHDEQLVVELNAFINFVMRYTPNRSRHWTNIDMCELMIFVASNAFNTMGSLHRWLIPFQNSTLQQDCVHVRYSSSIANAFVLTYTRAGGRTAKVLVQQNERGWFIDARDVPLYKKIFATLPLLVASFVKDKNRNQKNPPLGVPTLHTHEAFFTRHYPKGLVMTPNRLLPDVTSSSEHTDACKLLEYSKALQELDQTSYHARMTLSSPQSEEGPMSFRIFEEHMMLARLRALEQALHPTVSFTIWQTIDDMQPTDNKQSSAQVSPRLERKHANIKQLHLNSTSPKTNEKPPPPPFGLTRQTSFSVDSRGKAFKWKQLEITGRGVVNAPGYTHQSPNAGLYMPNKGFHSRSKKIKAAPGIAIPEVQLEIEEDGKSMSSRVGHNDIGKRFHSAMHHPASIRLTSSLHRIPAQTMYNPNIHPASIRGTHRNALIGLTLFSPKDLSPFLGDLGSGNTGVVKKILHIPTMTLLAAKTTPLSVVNKRKQMYGEFEAFFSHIGRNTNLIRFHGAFFQTGEVTIMLEYMNRGNLHSFCKNPNRYHATTPVSIVGSPGLTSVMAVQYLAREVLQGLGVLHDAHQIHRDIKPSNILLNSRGEVKITDFGLLKQLVMGPDGQVQKCAEYCGTMQYLSPERLDKTIHGGYDTSTDIYSFGLTILFAICGYLPIFGTAKTIWDLRGYFQKNTSLPVEPFLVESELWRREKEDLELHTHLIDFLNTCLAFNPSSRTTVRELLQHPFIATAKIPSDYIPPWGVQTGEYSAQDIEDLRLMLRSHVHSSKSKASAAVAAVDDGDERKHTDTKRGIPERTLSLTEPRPLQITPVNKIASPTAQQQITSAADTFDMTNIKKMLPANPFGAPISPIRIVDSRRDMSNGSSNADTMSFMLNVDVGEESMSTPIVSMIKPDPELEKFIVDDDVEPDEVETRSRYNRLDVKKLEDIAKKLQLDFVLVENTYNEVLKEEEKTV